MSEKSSAGAACGGGGITLGMLAAGLASWSVNHSLGWAILHALCSWFYVLYWAVAK